MERPLVKLREYLEATYAEDECVQISRTNSDWVENKFPRVVIAGRIPHKDNLDAPARRQVRRSEKDVRSNRFIWPERDVRPLGASADGDPPEYSKHGLREMVTVKPRYGVWGAKLHGRRARDSSAEFDRIAVQQPESCIAWTAKNFSVEGAERLVGRLGAGCPDYPVMPTMNAQRSSKSLWDDMRPAQIGGVTAGCPAASQNLGQCAFNY